MSGPLTGMRGLEIDSNLAVDWCGHLLAGLGAEILHVMPTGGDPHRGQLGSPDSHAQGIDWLAANAGKRLEELDLDQAGDRERFLDLVSGADFVLDGFMPGHLECLGIGYGVLSDKYPAIVLTSITPYGHSGPRSDDVASDLTLWAMGGAMALFGNADRAPLAFGTPQAYLHGGAHGALGTLIALHAARREGTGDHVDVSVQDAVIRTHMPAPVRWAYERELMPRLGVRMALNARVSQRILWPCLDGQLSFVIWGGALGKWTQPLADLIVASGSGETLRGIEWLGLDTYRIPEPKLLEIEESFAAFFRSHRRHALIALALEHRFPLAPVNSVADALCDEHLIARQFWEIHEEEGLADSVCWPGPPYRFSRTPAVGRPLPPTPAKWHPRPATASHRETASALAGLRVLDFSQIFAGPWATACLGDYGADVIRIESLAHPDPVRSHPPFLNNLPGPENSFMGMLSAGSKRSLALDLRTEAGRTLGRRLIEWADIVAESFSTGVIEKLGFGFDAISTIKPSIIMLSTSLEGRTGPRARSVGFGTDIQSRAGLVENCGWPDRGSALPHNAYGDNVAPWLSALAVLAAVHHRDRTGEGQYIEMPMYEALLNFATPAILRYGYDGIVPPRRGNRSDAAAPHGVFRCSGDDRWCAIAATTDQQWIALCGVIGRFDFAADDELRTLSGRLRHEHRLEAAIESWTQARPAEDVMRAMLNACVPAGVAQTMQDLMDRDVHAIQRGVLAYLDKPGFGPVLQYGPVPRLCRRPHHIGMPSRPGEDSVAICREVLGLSSTEIERLVAEKTLQ
ncbi:MAG: CoA transferase [Sphingomicrobium sp.]